MARVVKVDLLLEASRYIRGARDADKATEDLADALDDVARTSKDTTESTDKLGGGLDDLARDARRLDTEIAKTKTGIRDLAREIAQTSDAAKRTDLLKQLGLEQRGQRKLIKLRDLIDINDDGADDAARGFATRFGAKVGPLMASMPIGPGAAAAGAALAAAMAPTLGAGLAGAVIGGAAGAGIVGGAILAARDARVKAAGADLGAFVLGDLEKRSSAFVPVMLDSIGDVRAAWAAMGSDLSRIFASSRLVDPLVKGALSGVRRVVAGVADLVGEADPVVNALGMSFERLGDATGDTLTMLSQDADEGASALNDLTVATANLIRTAGGLVHVAANVKGYTDELDVALDKGRYWFEDNSALAEGLRNVGIRLDVTADGFKAGSVEAEAYRAATLGTAEAADFAVLKAAGMTDAQIAAADASGTYRARADEAAGAARNLAGGFTDGAQSVEEFQGKIQDLNEYLLNDGVQGNIAVEQANIRLEESIDRATEAAKRNGKGIDDNNPKQRANRDALVGIATAANAAAEEIYNNTHSHELAAGASKRGRTAFLNAADAMGVEKGEAIALANKLFAIPDEVNTDADFNPDNAGVRAWKNTLSGIPREIFTSARLRAIVNVETRRSIAKGATGIRWGGAFEKAAVGTLREAQTYSAVNPGRYMIAEPETGGEAFIPKYGDRRRSLNILEKAASWYGATVRPAVTLRPASGGTTVVNHYSIAVNVPATVNKAEVGREVVDAVKAYEQGSGKVWVRA